MRPTEHGEVFVTADGGEIDQDLGNYEHFLGIELTKKHYEKRRNNETKKLSCYLETQNSYKRIIRMV